MRKLKPCRRLERLRTATNPLRLRMAWEAETHNKKHYAMRFVVGAGLLHRQRGCVGGRTQPLHSTSVYFHSQPRISAAIGYERRFCLDALTSFLGCFAPRFKLQIGASTHKAGYCFLRARSALLPLAVSIQ